MTILADWEIDAYCRQKNLVEPYRPDNLNPASLDLELGFVLLIETILGFEAVDISTRTKEKPFWLQPGQFVLAETSERFNLPVSLSAQFVLKSSRAREGYNHMLAGWCDPGWHGSVLTLELKNNLQQGRLPLYPGLKIGQMVFYRMSAQPDRSYSETGHYNNHDRVMPSYSSFPAKSAA